MRILKYLLTFCIVLNCLLVLAQQPFTSGNIVIYRVGDGSTTLNDDFFKVYLDEYTPAGTLVQTIEMPSSGSQKLTNIGRLPESGMLTQSANGKYLVVPGYNESVGPLNDLKRSIGLVDFNGSVSSITAFDNLNFDELRTAATEDGTKLWLSGTNGLEYLPVGSTSANLIASFPGYSTGVNIVDGQLYASVAGAVPQIGKVGNGLPTTTNQSYTALPGINASTDNYCEQFAFADMDATIPGNDVLYLSSQATSGNGGIKKYSLVNGTWILNGTIGTTADRYSGLTIKVAANSVTIFAIRQGANNFSTRGGELVKVVDNSGYNGVLTGTPASVVAVATPNTKCYRGVALVPQPAPYTAGNIVLYRVGNGTTLNDDFFKVYLDEYTPAGTLVQTIEMPSSGSQKLTNIGRLPESGMLTQSANGKYLVVPGYNESVGPLNDLKRSIGLVDFNGSVSSITAFDNLNFDELRTAATEDGTKLWLSGTNGLEYLPVGSTSANLIASFPGYSTGVNIVDGQLYASVAGAVPQIGKVGNGLPTTTNQSYTALPGINASTDNYCEQFAFADMDATIPGNDVLYLSSQATSGNGGIKKYSLVNGTWILNGTIGTTADRYSGLTIKVAANSVTIFAIRQGANNFSTRGGELVKVVDNSGYNGVLTGTPASVVAVATPNTKCYRGVALVPLNCSMVKSLQAINVTASQVSLSWASSGGGNYEYAVSTSLTPPASGTTTTTTMVTVTGLSNNITYYAHVRSVCSAKSKSEWNTISFITSCKAPTAPQISIKIAATGQTTVSWLKVFGAASYEYAISTNAALPSAGELTNDTVFTVADLSAATTYYVHVRSNCGSGVFSTWTTKSFTTGCFTPTPIITILPKSTGASWNKINNAVKYEYALMSSAAKPLSGTITTDTTCLLNLTSDARLYYFHIRSICSSGDVSDWNTVPVEIQGLQAYPNPVKETLQLKINGGGDGDIIIGDAMGRIVDRIKVSGGSAIVDTRKWAAGIYLIRYSDQMNRYTIRVLKQ